MVFLCIAGRDIMVELTGKARGVDCGLSLATNFFYLLTEEGMPFVIALGWRMVPVLSEQ